MATYIGKRIVPVHCGKWDMNKAYEMLSIVLEETSGDSYIARRAVPSGTAITDTYYWMLHSLYSQQIKDMSDQLAAAEQRIKTDNDATEAAIRQDNDETESAIRADNQATRDHVDESLEQTTETLTETVTQARAAMTNQKTAFDQTAAALNTRMDAVLAAGTGDGETEILDARVDAEGTTHESLGAAIRETTSRLRNDLESQLFPMIGLIWHEGFVNPTGTITENSEYSYTDLIPCRSGKTIHFSAATAHTGVLGIAFFDSFINFISGIFKDVEDYTDKEVTVPDGAVFCRLSSHTNRIKDVYIKSEDGVLPDWINEFIEKRVGKRLTRMEEMSGIRWLPGYVNINGNEVVTDSSRFHTELIPCAPGLTVKYIGESDHKNVSVLSFYDQNGTFISGLQNTGAKGEEQTATSPDGSWFVRLSSEINILTSSYVRFSEGTIAANINNLSRRISKVEDGDTDSARAAASQIGHYLIPSTYLTVSGVQSNGFGRSTTDYILCPEGSAIRFMAETNHASVGAVCFYDVNKNFISSISNIGDMDTEYEATAPEGCWYLRLSTDNHHKAYVEVDDAITGTINKLVEGNYLAKSLPTYLRGLSSINFFNNAWKSHHEGTTEVEGGYIIDAGGYYFPALNVRELRKTERDIVVMVYSEDAVADAQITLCVSSSLGSRVGTNYSMNRHGNWFYRILSPDLFDEEHPDLIIACDNRGYEEPFTVKDISITEGIFADIMGEKEEPIVIPKHTAYVSITGSDENDGTAAHPYATVNKALEEGATNILMHAGIYKQSINLALTDNLTISIGCINETGRAIFEGTQSLIAETEEQVDGYERVFSAPVDKTFPANMRWIFQDGVAEVSTLITDEERHPLERGREYRCEDTRIIKTTATELDEALAEIEDAEDFKWFYDTVNKRLYFSRPQELTAEYPLKSHFGSETLFVNANRNKTLLLTGIETRYLTFNVVFTIGSHIVDCRAANVVAAGGFLYNRSVGAEFVRCEALHVNTGGNGDGFNGHSSNSGDPFSKQTTVSLIDCWSHGNQDDGYSDHERSEITIIGGLYEWNGKGGITPSYGSHCTCYNVMSRHNYSGFYYTGTAEESEGGKYGQCVCIECLAEKNDRGHWKSGFRVDGNGNRMLCIGCRSIGNEYAFTAGNTAFMKLIDCRAKDNTKSIKGDAVENITVENTELVE